MSVSLIEPVAFWSWALGRELTGRRDEGKKKEEGPLDGQLANIVGMRRNVYTIFWHLCDHN